MPLPDNFSDVSDLTNEMLLDWLETLSDRHLLEKFEVVRYRGAAAFRATISTVYDYQPLPSHVAVKFHVEAEITFRMNAGTEVTMRACRQDTPNWIRRLVWSSDNSSDRSILVRIALEMNAERNYRRRIGNVEDEIERDRVTAAFRNLQGLSHS